MASPSSSTGATAGSATSSSNNPSSPTTLTKPPAVPYQPTYSMDRYIKDPVNANPAYAYNTVAESECAHGRLCAARWCAFDAAFFLGGGSQS